MACSWSLLLGDDILSKSRKKRGQPKLYYCFMQLLILAQIQWHWYIMLCTSFWLPITRYFIDLLLYPLYLLYCYSWHLATYPIQNTSLIHYNAYKVGVLLNSNTFRPCLLKVNASSDILNEKARMLYCASSIRTWIYSLSLCYHFDASVALCTPVRAHRRRRFDMRTTLINAKKVLSDGAKGLAYTEHRWRIKFQYEMHLPFHNSHRVYSHRAWLACF